MTEYTQLKRKATLQERLRYYTCWYYLCKWMLQYKDNSKKLPIQFEFQIKTKNCIYTTRAYIIKIVCGLYKLSLDILNLYLVDETRSLNEDILSSTITDQWFRLIRPLVDLIGSFQSEILPQYPICSKYIPDETKQLLMNQQSLIVIMCWLKALKFIKDTTDPHSTTIEPFQKAIHCLTYLSEMNITELHPLTHKIKQAVSSKLPFTIGLEYESQFKLSHALHWFKIAKKAGYINIDDRIKQLKIKTSHVYRELITNENKSESFQLAPYQIREPKL